MSSLHRQPQCFNASQHVSFTEAGAAFLYMLSI